MANVKLYRCDHCNWRYTAQFTETHLYQKEVHFLKYFVLTEHPESVTEIWECCILDCTCVQQESFQWISNSNTKGVRKMSLSLIMVEQTDKSACPKHRQNGELIRAADFHGTSQQTQCQNLCCLQHSLTSGISISLQLMRRGLVRLGQGLNFSFS